MKLSRTDVGALAAVAVGGAVGLAMFGPRMWAGDSTVTVDVRTEILHEVGSEEVVVTIRGEGDGEHFEWTSETGEHTEASEHSGESGENVFLLRTSQGAEPLVYVDGELSDHGVLDELDPDRIERIEVLKGEGAVESYGPEATVGVIQIFTKEGSGSN